MNTASVILTPDQESCYVERSTDSSPSTTRDADAIVGTNYPWITSNMEGHYGAGPAIKTDEVSTREGTADPVTVREFMKRYNIEEIR